MHQTDGRFASRLPPARLADFLPEGTWIRRDDGDDPLAVLCGEASGQFPRPVGTSCPGVRTGAVMTGGRWPELIGRHVGWPGVCHLGQGDRRFAAVHAGTALSRGIGRRYGSDHSQRLPEPDSHAHGGTRARGTVVSRIGLGLAALGRPAYITSGREGDLPDRSVARLRPDLLDAGRCLHGRGQVRRRGSFYGRAEEFLAGWLAERGHGDVIVGSKWGYRYTAGCGSRWSLRNWQKGRCGPSGEIGRT